MWCFVNSMENKGAEGGFWKPRGEPRDIVGDASVDGRVATHEFFEEQGPHAKKTNWLMLEDYLSLKVSREAVLAKYYPNSTLSMLIHGCIFTLLPVNGQFRLDFMQDANSLCKVFCSSNSPPSNGEMMQNGASTEIH
ncbi:hypothetical protein NL676_002189 [Syzygium grande]|nr:hypothetical protein NL676_002189 [Syzygium grande]